MGKEKAEYALGRVNVNISKRAKYAGNLTIQEQRSSLSVRSNALQQSKGIADSVGSSRGQLGRVQQRIYGDDLLQQRGHNAYQAEHS